MINLFMAIFCSSSNSLILKFAGTKSKNNVSLLLVNYIVAVVFGSMLVVRNLGTLNMDALGRMPMFAVLNGIFYVTTFVMMQLNVKKNGATVTGSLSHMGLMIPVLVSIFLFADHPNRLQTFGVAVAIASLVVISIPSKDGTAGTSAGSASSASSTATTAAANNLRWLLIPMLLLSGCADVMSKIFEAYCDHSLEDLFVSATFVVALALCVIVYFLSHERINRWDIGCGLVLGVSNYMSTKFMIMALYVIPAYMAYITFGLGVVVFINCVNALVMHEKLSRRDYIGMVLSMGAIVLLNL